MPNSRKPTEQHLGAAPPAEVPVVHATTEEDFAAALNAGAFVSADPDILDKFGMADDHGENVVELEEIVPDLLPPS